MGDLFGLPPALALAFGVDLGERAPAPLGLGEAAPPLVAPPLVAPPFGVDFGELVGEARLPFLDGTLIPLTPLRAEGGRA